MHLTPEHVTIKLLELSEVSFKHVLWSQLNQQNLILYQSSLLSKYIKITKKEHKNPGHAVALQKDYNRQAG